MNELGPPLLIGLTFFALGLAKLYGVATGVTGGADVSPVDKLCGT